MKISLPKISHFLREFRIKSGVLASICFTFYFSRIFKIEPFFHSCFGRTVQSHDQITEYISHYVQSGNGNAMQEFQSNGKFEHYNFHDSSGRYQCASVSHFERIDEL